MTNTNTDKERVELPISPKQAPSDDENDEDAPSTLKQNFIALLFVIGFGICGGVFIGICVSLFKLFGRLFRWQLGW